MNRYRLDFMGGEMEVCGDGDFVFASEAEESFLRAKAEGFEEFRQAVLGLLDDLSARYPEESGVSDAAAEISDPQSGQEELP